MNDSDVRPRRARVATGLVIAALLSGLGATAIIPLNYSVYVGGGGLSTTFWVLAALQLALGVAAGILALVSLFCAGSSTGRKVLVILGAIVGVTVGLGGPLGVVLAKIGDDFARLLVAH